MLEHCYFAVTPCCPAPVGLGDILAQIEQAGPEHVVLSSDLGQMENPAPVAGLGRFLEGLGRLGLSRETLRRMVAENPGRLLLG